MRLTKRALDARESARFSSIFLASSFFCPQAESMVRYGGGQRKRLATLSFFCSQTESTCRYGGGQRKPLKLSNKWGILITKFMRRGFIRRGTYGKIQTQQ